MAEKSKKDGGQRYDWEMIKLDYVTDPLSSQQKISKKYGVSLVSIRKHSKAEDWLATKKKYQRDVTEKVIKKVSAKNADKLANAIIAASNIADAILKASEDPEQFRRYIVQEGSAESYGSAEYVFEKMDMKAAKEAIAALKGVDDLLRGYHNIQKAEALNKQQIERERLELEREKFEFEKQKAEFSKPDSSNVIRIEGYEEGWSK